MIKKQLRGNNLKSRVYDFIDTNSVSKDYFRVDLPERFYIGKNGISINPTQQLLKGSAIEIDIVDVDGNFVYYEVTNIITETNSRLISVYIYPDISLGDITIYISGTTTDGFSFLWSSKILLSWKEIDNSPIYESLPTVILQEQNGYRLNNLKNIGYTSSYSNGIDLSISSREPVPINKSNIIDDKLPIYTTPLKIINKNQIFNVREMIIGERSFSSSANITGVTTENPIINYKDYSKVKTSDSFFTKGMVGGWLYVNLTERVQSLLTGVNLPTSQKFKDYYSGSLLYSSSITDVIDDKTAIIYPKFKYELKNYITFDNLENYVNFSSSYSLPTTGSIKSDDTSYLYFQIHDLDPVIGNVKNLEVNYNTKTNFNNPATLISTPITQVDLLIDANNYLVGTNNVEFKSFGFPSVSTDVSQSWSYNLFGHITASFNPADKTSENGLIFLSHSRIYNNDYIALYTTSSYDFVGLRNTNYDIQFEATSELELLSTYQGKNGKATIPALDIYLSGSLLQTETDVNISKQYSNRYGNYLGSINNHSNFKTSFVPKEDSLYKLYFIIRGGIWKIRKLKIVPSKPFGFTPNVFYIKMPTPISIQSSDVNFTINFGNNKPLHINNFFVSGTKL